MSHVLWEKLLIRSDLRLVWEEGGGTLRSLHSLLTFLQDTTLHFFSLIEAIWVSRRSFFSRAWKYSSSISDWTCPKRNKDTNAYTTKILTIQTSTVIIFILVIIIILLLYISGNETKDASWVNLITVAGKPEEICKQGCLLCEPETPGLTPTLPR